MVECCKVVIVTLLVLIIKDKVEELSNYGLKVFAIDTAEETKKSSLKVPHQSANLMEFVGQE